MYINNIALDLYEAQIPKYTNRLDPATISVGKVFDTDNSSWWTTDYIDIEGNAYLYTQYIYRTADNAANKVNETVTFYAGRIQFYDANKQAVGSILSAQSAPVAIPQTAKFVRVVWSMNLGHRLLDDVENAKYYFVGVSSNNALESMPWEYYHAHGTGATVKVAPDAVSPNPHNPLYGKHIVLFGDSLTDAYGGHFPVEVWEKDGAYPYPRIAQEFGFTFLNLAHSGSNISTHATTGYTDKNGCASLDAYLDKVDNGTDKAADVIIIAFGSNEYAQYVGTSSDTSADTTTYCGALKYFIERIRDKLPMCQIGVILPPFSDWAKGGNTYKDPAAAAEAALPILQTEGYNVPYIDMRYGTGITSSMATDGVHVNRDGIGRELYYRAVRRFLLGL